ncbi:DUF1440 domain-containing protein [Hymenobacter gummosus]|uniref:DUF1440 domain-containing protein n=1 Tax=Hymenobacter gummosus TaxID=1776032 RepID=A0A3S0JDB2_9BACT|nr:DUF1440 domain-containing protein [Hymenobacter gummosus]RTQ48861.1 DUF1440 domain-containing protein [Hymenobacter gummosus]
MSHFAAANSPSAPVSTTRAALRAGLLAGTLDISAALLVFSGLLQKLGPQTLLQSVASGALGKAAYAGGWATALLGLGLHYLIALLWAALYVAAARAWPALRRQWVLGGVLYGVVVWAVMNLVVLPLSRAGRGPLTLQGIVINLVILILMVGLPIAWTTRRAYAGRE